MGEVLVLLSRSSSHGCSTTVSGIRSMKQKTTHIHNRLANSLQKCVKSYCYKVRKTGDSKTMRNKKGVEGRSND